MDIKTENNKERILGGVKKMKKIVSGGMGMIEIIVVVGIIATSFFTVTSVASNFVARSAKESNFNKAVQLAKESIEVVRVLRDATWSGSIASKSVNTWYYPTNNGTAWSLTLTSPGLVGDRFLQAVKFDRVYRDAQDDIASSGTEDINIRKVTSKVDWFSGVATQSISLETYVSNYLNN
jgi:type II secretory pathway pseudopilin PulG